MNKLRKTPVTGSANRTKVEAAVLYAKQLCFSAALREGNFGARRAAEIAEKSKDIIRPF
jgi:hypothetical protein